MPASALIEMVAHGEIVPTQARITVGGRPAACLTSLETQPQRTLRLHNSGSKGNLDSAGESGFFRPAGLARCISFAQSGRRNSAARRVH